MALSFRMRQRADGRWRATADGYPIEVEGRDAKDCVRKVNEAALKLLPAMSWEHGPPVVFVEVTPRLVGVAEAAEVLTWDKRRVATYVKRGSFPEPVAELAGGRVWRLDDVLAFAEEFRARQRRRGATRLRHPTDRPAVTPGG
jgi:hypothetical protein